MTLSLQVGILVKALVKVQVGIFKFWLVFKTSKITSSEFDVVKMFSMN